MASVRHRRRLGALRAFAILVPALAVVFAGLAFIVDGPWARIGAAVGAAAAAILGFFVVRLERKLRVDVAAARAEIAAEYADIQARSTEEHQEFTDHMTGLLDFASGRIDVMRYKLDALQAEIAQVRNARADAAPSEELSKIAEGAEWNELWPDLSEAPTVVDLMKWEDINAELMRAEAADAESSEAA